MEDIIKLLIKSNCSKTQKAKNMLYDYDLTREVIGTVVVEKVNLTRATVKEAEIFKDRLMQDSLSGFNKIVIDFTMCNFIDSSMIGAIVVMLKRVRERGGDVHLVIPKTNVLQVFTVTGLNKAFRLYDNVEDAVNAFV